MSSITMELMKLTAPNMRTTSFMAYSGARSMPNTVNRRNRRVSQRSSIHLTHPMARSEPPEEQMRPVWPPLLLLFLAPAVPAKFDQLLAHFQPRDAEPAGGFSLIALRQLNCLFEKLRLQIGDHAQVRILNLAVLRARQQICDVSRVRAFLTVGGPPVLGGNLLNMLQTNGKGPRQQQGLSH